MFQKLLVECSSVFDGREEKIVLQSSVQFLQFILC